MTQRPASVFRTRVVVIGTLLASCASGPHTVGAPEEPPACMRSLQGTWDGDRLTIHVEGRRIVVYRDGRMRIAGRVVGCTGATVRLLLPAVGVLVMDASVDAENLELTPSRPGPGSLAGKRRASAFEPPPLRAAPLGSPSPLTAERVAEIEAELRRRVELDQAVRRDPQRAAEMESVDVDNTAYLTRLIAEVGWIDVERFGKESAIGAFLIVQHSGELPLMMAALPALERGMKLDPDMGESYALLYDRLHLMLGERQRYGSQIGSDEHGSLVVLPLEDPARVDDRRRKVGLPPLGVYTAAFEDGNGGRHLGILGLD